MQNQNMTANRNLISEKELLYITDFMSWELLAVKKCHDAANRCQDQEIKTMITQIRQKHQQHYDCLLQQLH